MKLSRKRLRILFYLCTTLLFGSLTMLLILNLTGHHSPIAVIVNIGGLCCCTAMPLFLIRAKRDRNLIEQLMAENTARYHGIIAASNTGAWEYHSDTQHQWCSPEYFEMLGYDSKDFLKNNKFNIQEIWMDLLHPDDREAAIAQFAQYTLRKSPDMYESHFRMKHKNGDWIWIWSRGRTLTLHDGTMSNITLGTHTDITRQKNMEIRLLGYNDKLIKYAHLIAHEVRGPVARLIGLIRLSRITPDIDYPWFFDKMHNEVLAIDKILKTIAEELNEIDEFHVQR